jgi:hypothetical protein
VEEEIHSVGKLCKLSHRKEVIGRGTLKAFTVAMKDHKEWKKLWVDMGLKCHAGEPR